MTRGSHQYQTLYSYDQSQFGPTRTMKNNQYKNIMVAIFLILLWNIAAWFIAKNHYITRVQSVVEQETRLSQERTSDLADSLQRNLNYISGIPDLLSQLIRVKNAASRFSANSIPSPLPLEIRQKRWTDDPALNDLSRYLHLAQISLHVDLIYVVNAAGDCIAASNFSTPGSPIGSNYAERNIFRLNRNGQRGMQYAVGKTTHIPGLFFATPIIIEGQFLGAVVAKVDVPNLTFLMGQISTFVTDENGVIILARDKGLEMHSIPGASVEKMPEKNRFDRYRISNFPTLQIEPWEDKNFKSLLRVQSQNVPHILISKDVPEYGMKVYVDNEVADFRSLNQDNSWFAFLLGISGSILILMVYSAVHYVGSVKRSKAQLWRQANFDMLTELPNRSLFHDHLDQEIKKSNRSKLPLGLLLIDLDQFKEINDTLGHVMGDILLKEVALRIRACVRKSDTVARLGGDEFTVILPNLSDKSHIDDIAQKIIRKLAEPFHLGSEVVHVSASIGITLYPNDAAEAGLLVKNVDQAMYVAKKQGRNRFCYFTHSLQEAAQKRLRLTNDLRGALAANQFSVYFQPIVELATGRIHKAEALLRWNHTERGMVSPVEFIPLAEETGLIHEIGDWVFKESARWAKHWSSQFADDFQVSINKSPVQFRVEGRIFAAEWLRYLQGLGLSGKNIVIEITEGLLLNAESDVINKLLVFRDAGIQVAIDDFGTGYSSLSYLKQFDIDYLKIDRQFVRNLETETNDLVLCEAIIMMAHKLGLKVIAEGVETEVQRNMLTAAGCDYAQGYLFSKPIPPGEFEVMLQAN